MREQAGVPLSQLTTLRLGGPARRLVDAVSAEEVVAAVSAADRAGDRVLLVGGGSNLVVADEGFAGTAVRVVPKGVSVRREGDAVELVVAAGEDWDALVARAVEEGWAGLETMSGVPGLTGATPVQNVGAYGRDVSETISAVTVLDRDRGEVRRMAPAECRFGYRTSVLKRSDRLVVLDVAFGLRAAPHGGPVRYAELAAKLGVRPGEPAPIDAVRDAVLDLRRGKGMVLDPADHDTWSVGSFFTNPVLGPAQLTALEAQVEQRLGAGVSFPRFAQDDGAVKTSAAWLIERAGFAKGYGAGAARISTKHTLALTNRGGASTAELLALARELRDGVGTAFGVDLVPEPTLVGVTL